MSHTLTVIIRHASMEHWVVQDLLAASAHWLAYATCMQGTGNMLHTLCVCIYMNTCTLYKQEHIIFLSLCCQPAHLFCQTTTTITSWYICSLFICRVVQKQETSSPKIGKWQLLPETMSHDSSKCDPTLRIKFSALLDAQPTKLCWLTSLLCNEAGSRFSITACTRSFTPEVFIMLQALLQKIRRHECYSEGWHIPFLTAFTC